jgi:hypothetical protein
MQLPAARIVHFDEPEADGCSKPSEMRLFLVRPGNSNAAPAENILAGRRRFTQLDKQGVSPWGLGYELTPGAWVNVANLDLFSDSIISPFGADDEPERGTYRARAVSPDFGSARRDAVDDHKDQADLKIT